MLLGIVHVHNSDLVHRDIKPNNFLLGADMWTVRLSDFGMAVKLAKGGTLKGHSGTPPYMSPEMVGNKAYHQKTDIWSYAVSLYVLLYGIFPYTPQDDSPEAIKAAIRTGSPEPAFARPVAENDDTPEVREETARFVRSVMVRNPKARLTSIEALKQPFVDKAPSSHSESDFDQVELMTPRYCSYCKRTRALQAKISMPDQTETTSVNDLLDNLSRMQKHAFSEEFITAPAELSEVSWNLKRSNSDSIILGSTSSSFPAMDVLERPGHKSQFQHQLPMSSAQGIESPCENKSMPYARAKAAQPLKVSL
jgi:serine/threonine protein kinase